MRRVGFVLFAGSIYENLKYFETLHADQLQHKIVKRGINPSTHPYNSIKEVNFNAFGKQFRVILTPKRGILHSNFKAYTVNGDGDETTVHLDHDNFFDGRLFGENQSHANVHIDNGVMTASIQDPQDTYHIEVISLDRYSRRRVYLFHIF